MFYNSKNIDVFGSICPFHPSFYEFSIFDLGTRFFDYNDGRSQSLCFFCKKRIKKLNQDAWFGVASLDIVNGECAFVFLAKCRSIVNEILELMITKRVYKI